MLAHVGHVPISDTRAMSSFFNRIARLATFGKTKVRYSRFAQCESAADVKRLVGKDLEGNKYFELPPVNSECYHGQGCPRRC